MKKILSIAFLCLTVLASGCASRDGDADDDGYDTDAGVTGDDSGNGDDVPPPESAAWPCRGGKDSGGDYFECNPNFMTADSALPDTWVGVCPSEGINGYWSGPKKVATLHANGWLRLYLTGTATDCELTIAQCENRTDAKCWLQYGTNTVNDSAAGPYRWCGGSNGDCAMKLRRNAGHRPTALGN